jgi:hypothetical protein
VSFYEILAHKIQPFPVKVNQGYSSLIKLFFMSPTTPAKARFRVSPPLLSFRHSALAQLPEGDTKAPLVKIDVRSAAGKGFPTRL